MSISEPHGEHFTPGCESGDALLEYSLSNLSLTALLLRLYGHSLICGCVKGP